MSAASSGDILDDPLPVPGGTEAITVSFDLSCICEGQGLPPQVTAVGVYAGAHGPWATGVVGLGTLYLSGLIPWRAGIRAPGTIAPVGYLRCMDRDKCQPDQPASDFEQATYAGAPEISMRRIETAATFGRYFFTGINLNKSIT